MKAETLQFVIQAIEALKQTKRKFEIVSGTIKDGPKKDNISSSIAGIEKDIKKLNMGVFTVEDLKKYKIDIEVLTDYIGSTSMEIKGEYKILRNVPILKLNKFCRNEEINSIWSYFLFFGREYLGLLSEQNLRLDYGHAYQRDRFFNNYNACLRVIENYGNVLEQLDNATASGGKEFKERLLNLQSKQYRDVIVHVGKFAHSIEAFIEDILEAEKDGEKVLLEPEKIIEIKGEMATIDGITTRQALMDLYLFIEEFIQYIKIPDLKKINDEDDR